MLWKHKALIFLAVIVSIGAFLKFYGLNDNLHFDVDEANHTSTVFNMIKNLDPVTQGPPASSDSPLYHGAYYYYVLVPATLIGWGNPIIIASFFIICSLLSIILLYFALEHFFGKRIAFATIIIYTLSYSAILYSRWIWNPNLIPFFFSLALFSLAQIDKNKKIFLPVLFFAVGSIAQVHVGSLFFPLVLLPIVPFLISKNKGKKYWILAIILLVIPFLPTIYFELKNNFPLINGFVDLLNKPSSTPQTFLSHIDKGYNYMAFMFDVITKLSREFFIISALSFLAFLINLLNYKRKPFLFSLFLLLSTIYVFLVSSYYPDTLFIHFAEELFILLPIALGIFIGYLFKHWATFPAAIFIIILFVMNNFSFYEKDIISGDKQLLTEKKMCQIIKDNDLNQVTISVETDKFPKRYNPEYLSYFCDRYYDIKSNRGPLVEFVTDWENKLEYKIPN